MSLKNKKYKTIDSNLAFGYDSSIKDCTMNIMVRQHNKFVAAPYSVDFTSHEFKLIEYMISLIKIIDKNLIESKIHKEFTFSASEISKILNTHLSRVVKDADKLADSITSKKIIEKQVDVNGNVQEFSYIPIISYANYSKGIFKFSLNYYVLKYFIDINTNFTEFQLRYLLSLTTAYSGKLYKMLLQYKNIGHRTFDITELKEQFGLLDKYPQFGNFKQKIIDPSICYINEKTDLFVEYQELKIGRKVEKLEFKFYVKKGTLIKNESSNIIDVSARVNEDFTNIETLLGNKSSDVSDKTKVTLSNLISKQGIVFVECSILYAKKNAKTNFEKYLMDTIENNWAEVDIQKLELKRQAEEIEKKNKQAAIEEKNKQIELENTNKSEIEHLFIKLTDSEQTKYLDLANHILKKYSAKLSYCDAETLSYSVFAVSHGRYYDRKIETYISKLLNQSLDVNDYLV